MAPGLQDECLPKRVMAGDEELVALVEPFKEPQFWTLRRSSVRRMPLADWRRSSVKDRRSAGMRWPWFSAASTAGGQPPGRDRHRRGARCWLQAPFPGHVPVALAEVPGAGTAAAASLPSKQTLVVRERCEVCSLVTR